MKYVALLRGINVGGNNIIKMTELKACIESCGFTTVTTYIQSGNVIFESDNKNLTKIVNQIEAALTNTFFYSAKVVVRSYDQMSQVISHVPKEWHMRNDIRCYIAFIKDPLTPQDALKEIALKEDVDFVETGPGVLYMTTLLSGLTKSTLSKLPTKKSIKI